jgi:hypothetical protein
VLPTDTFRHKDPYLVAIAKAILSVSKRLRNIIDIIQTRQASYVIVLAQVTSFLNKLAAKLEDFLIDFLVLYSYLGGIGYYPRAMIQPASPAALRPLPRWT